MIASGFSWYHLIPGIEDGSALPFANVDGHAYGYVFVSACAVAALVIALAFVANRALAAAAARQGLEQHYADDTLTVRTFAEVYVGWLMDTMGGLLPKADVARYLPLVGGLFTYIAVSNLTSLVPGFQPPTDNVNSNLGMAVIVLFVYWAVGLARDAKGFLGHMMGPVLAIAPLIFAIELFGMVLVRPATLTIRLTANIFGDHTVFNIMSGLVPWGVPAVFLGLALLVSLIQAYVFSLLTTVYISLSLPHGDHDHHDHDHH